MINLAKEGTVVRYFAIKCEQNGIPFFLSMIPSSILVGTSFVSRREDSSDGFQRLLNPTRAKAIANYLDKERKVIPSALILSSQLRSNFTYLEKTHEIEFTCSENSFLVIDGQHRLFGLQQASNSYETPVVIFDKLKSSDEVRLFIDINTTQKGVPSALLLDIKSKAGTETKIEERQRILFDRMNTESVMKGKFSATKTSRGKISRTLFYESTLSVFSSGNLKLESDDTIFKAVSNYIDAFYQTLTMSKNSSAEITKSIYFKSCFNLFHEVSERTIKEYNNLKVESFLKVLEPISTLQFDRYVGTSNQAVKTITNDMRNAITQGQTSIITDEMF